MEWRDCARASKAFQRLLAVYEGREADSRPGQAVTLLGGDVPEELLLAAGLRPRRLRAEPNPVGMARSEEILELAFDEQSRRWFARLLEEPPRYLVASNSGDTCIKLYYYLRELGRRGDCALPQLTLLDWLYTDKPLNRRWNEKELRRFGQLLEEWTGAAIPAAALKQSLALCEADRAALRELLRLRHGASPRLSGAEALVALGSSAYMDKAAHEALVRQLAEEATVWPVLSGRRLMLLGSPQEDLRLYALLEKLGFTVVGESHDWGEALCTPAPEGDDPMAVLAARLLSGLPRSKRSLPDRQAAALKQAAADWGAELALCFAWSGDEAVSWDIPSLRQALPLPLLVLEKQPYSLEGTEEALVRLMGGK